MKRKLLLVIKHLSAAHAREAAEARGFEVSDVVYQVRLARYRLEVCGEERVAARWLGEDVDVSPVPQGALLFYNYL